MNLKLAFGLLIGIAIVVAATTAVVSWVNPIVNWIYRYQELTAGLLTAAVVVAGFFFAWWQLKDMAKDRHAQILLALNREWLSHDMQEARRYMAKRVRETKQATQGAKKEQPEEAKELEEDKANIVAELIKAAYEKAPEETVQLLKVADFFENMGLMVGKKFIHPPELILEMHSSSVEFYWEVYKNAIRRLREKEQEEDIFEWFEFLYTRATAYKEAKRTHKGPPERRPKAKNPFRKLADEFD